MRFRRKNHVDIMARLFGILMVLLFVNIFMLNIARAQNADTDSNSNNHGDPEADELYRAGDLSLMNEEFYDQNLSPYQDVPLDDWKYQAIKQLANKGLLGRVSSQSFSLDRVLTRYEMAMLVEEILSNYIDLEQKGMVTIQRAVEVAQASQEGAGDLIEIPKPTGRALAPGSLRVLNTGEQPKPEEKKEEPKEQKTQETGEKQASPEVVTLETLNQRVDLSLKDIAALEELVNSFKKSMEKNEKLLTNLKKDLAEIQRFDSKVTRDIEKLKDEDLRFKITGADRLRFSASENVDNSSTSFYNSLDLYISSRPSSLEDSQVNFSMSTGNTFGDDSGSWGLGVGDISMYYNNYQRGSKPPRKIELRSFKFGSIGFGWISPLSLWNVSWEGFHTDFRINDFTLEMAATKKKHNSFDQYIYAFSLSSTIFGNPLSIFRINRLVSWDDKDSRSAAAGTWSGDTLYYPPERNNVSSLWVNYPLYNKGGISSNVMAEYAHTKYYRPEWVFAVSRSDPTPNTLHTVGGGHTNWYRLGEMDNTGRAMAILLLIKYRGINVFPLGWVWMDKHFASKNLGIPGVDDLTDKLDIGGLPINIQALEVFAGRVEYNRVTEDNYKLEFLYVTGGEHVPMWLDPGMACAGESSGMLCPFNGAAGTLTLGLNTRRGMIDVPYYMNGKITYYVSNNIALTGSIDKTLVGLDSNYVDTWPYSGDGTADIKDDVGNVIVSNLGDGLIDNACLNAENQNMRIKCDINRYTINYTMLKYTYTVSWQTSSNGRYNFEYRIEQQGGTSSDSNLQSLLPNEQKRYWSHSFDYKLSNSTSMSFSYSYDYDAGYSDNAYYEEKDPSKNFSVSIDTSF